MAENQPGKFQNIALYLNFDMVGSPNYMLGVYDGNNDAFPPEESATAPEGSAAIEKMYAGSSTRSAPARSRPRSAAAATTARSSPSTSRPAACSPARRA